MDKYRHDNRPAQWRNRTSAKLRRARQLAAIPKRLIFVTVAAMAAFVAQFVMQHSDRMPELNFPNWTGPGPGPASIAGVASVIDGDTIEIHGRRVGVNGIDAPESAQRCHDAKGFRYQCGANVAAALDGFLAASRPVTCTFVAWDRYNRFVANCQRADGPTSPHGWSNMARRSTGPNTATARMQGSRQRPRRRRSVCGPDRFRRRGNGALGLEIMLGRL